MRNRAYTLVQCPPARNMQGRRTPSSPSPARGRSGRCARARLNLAAGLAAICAGWALAAIAWAARGADVRTAVELMAASIAAMWFGIGLIVGGGRR